MTDSAASQSSWSADRLLPGFESETIAFAPDYDGEVVATLIRKAGATPRARAVLYVHGFVDYFFQRHMAERFEAAGWSFYALDLRKHGRSLLAHQHPSFCKRVDEYFADITRALLRIEVPVLLAGHSTGGLIASLYANAGEQRARVRELWLNSPFFDFKATPASRFKLATAAATGILFPFMKDPAGLSVDYVKSIHRDFGGEWDFDLRLKPLRGFPVYFGWVGGIRAAHARVHAGLAIGCPVLSMYSDAADIVLDWRDIAKWSPSLGSRVELAQFAGGLHDLVLSAPDIRERVFSALFAWLERSKA